MEQILMNDKEIKNKIIMMCVEMFIARHLIHKEAKEKIYEELVESEVDNVYTIKIFPMAMTLRDNLKKTIRDKTVPKGTSHAQNLDETKEYKNYVIRLFREKLTAISKTSGTVDFLNDHKDAHVFLILKDAGQKVINKIADYTNTELLYEEEMLINPLDHELQPEFYPFDINNKAEMTKFFKEYYCNKAQIEKLDEDSPICRFLGLKQGQLIRIIRPSEVSGKSPAYRIVKKSLQIKK